MGIVNKLPQFINRVQSDAARAIAQALVIGGSETAARTPQDTSTLVNSQFKFVRKEEGRIVGTIGYTADYALPVHEAEGKLKGLPRPKVNGKAHGVFWGPHGEPEFLRKGMEAAEPKIREEIVRALKR